MNPEIPNRLDIVGDQAWVESVVEKNLVSTISNHPCVVPYHHIFYESQPVVIMRLSNARVQVFDATSGFRQQTHTSN